MEKMIIKKVINGVEQEIELTEEEINSIYSAKQLVDDIKECDGWLCCNDDFKALVSEEKDDFLVSMAKSYRENVNTKNMGPNETFVESFWEVYSQIEPHVDVADNPYHVKDMFRLGCFMADMLPIHKAAAMELFDKEVEVYALLFDEYVELIKDKINFAEYNEDSDMFGVLKRDWEAFVHKDDLPAIL